MIRWILYTSVTWMLGFLTLFLAGSLLGWLSQRLILQPWRASGINNRRVECLVRALYELVIILSAGYYYLSILLLILLVIGISAALLYLFSPMSLISISVAILAGILLCIMLYVSLHSILIAGEEHDLGRPLGKDEAPALWSLVQEVAVRSGTRPVDAIYVTPASRIGVTERGIMLKRLCGSGQRCLVLGLGMLNGMNQAQFKSILAHEYGHFVIHDTAGDVLAWPVRASMNVMRQDLARLSLAAWYNPAWLAYKGYRRIFLRITQGSSRLHELLADRHATLLYGMQNTIDGLVHLACQSILFSFQVENEVRRAQQASERLHNLYILPPPTEGEMRNQLKERIRSELMRPTRPDDSHLSLHDRIGLLEQSNTPSPCPETKDQRPSWDLLPNPVCLQEEMTAFVQANVDRRNGK